MPKYKYPKAVKTTYMENQGIHNQITAEPKAIGEMFNLEQVPPAVASFPHNTNSLNRDSFIPHPVVKPERPEELVNIAKAPFQHMSTSRANLVNWGPHQVNREKHP